MVPQEGTKLASHRIASDLREYHNFKLYKQVIVSSCLRPSLRIASKQPLLIWAEVWAS
jgi:hypothetical protein